MLLWILLCQDDPCNQKSLWLHETMMKMWPLSSLVPPNAYLNCFHFLCYWAVLIVLMVEEILRADTVTGISFPAAPGTMLIPMFMPCDQNPNSVLYNLHYFPYRYAFSFVKKLGKLLTAFYVPNILLSSSLWLSHKEDELSLLLIYTFWTWEKVRRPVFCNPGFWHIVLFQ